MACPSKKIYKAKERTEWISQARTKKANTVVFKNYQFT